MNSIENFLFLIQKSKIYSPEIPKSISVKYSPSKGEDILIFFDEEKKSYLEISLDFCILRTPFLFNLLGHKQDYAKLLKDFLYGYYCAYKKLDYVNTFFLNKL